VGIVFQQLGLSEVLNRSHMLLHRLGAQPLVTEVFAERLQDPRVACEHCSARREVGWLKRGDDALMSK